MWKTAQTRQQNKEMQPDKPKRRWRRRIIWLLLWGLVFALTTDSVTPEKATDLALNAFTAGQQFNWVGWEMGAMLNEAGWWLRGQPVPEDEADQKDIVTRWLSRQEEIQALDKRIKEEYAQLSQPERETLPALIVEQETTLTALRGQQEEATPEMERILAYQVSQILRTEGFSIGSEAWPPVTFRFVELPTYLIISPRNEISTRWDANLAPAMPEPERESLENAIETKLGLSALVDNVGGIGSWPTMVGRSTSLAWMVETVAHEWTHNYLLFHPLGLNYYTSRDLKTMNETVASMVGTEVGSLVLARYYPELVSLPEPPKSGEAPKTPPDEFSESMRRIRLRVDALLAAGQIDEAEAFMETERQVLVEKGYTLRRLNQAYFAFHGSYATSPASVDPIGPWLAQLRAQNPTLKSFLAQVAAMDSLDDLLLVIEDTAADDTALNK